MTFIDQRLLDRVAYGFIGGPSYATTRVALISGRERRNAERSRPLMRYTAPYDRIDTDHHAELINAYNACLGPVHSFRFKDRADYQLEDVTIGTAVGGTDETMQIVKPYTFGTETNTRTITKPVDSLVFTDAVALSVTADDVPISFSCDYLTGIVTFTVTGGEVIKVTGEFDVPVHFDDDQLQFTFDNWRAHSTDVVLLEDFGA